MERHIKTLTLSNCTFLLHAIRHWPEMISTILWPFALKESSRRHNLFRINEHGQTPASSFSRTDPEFDFNQEHTWGCPVYVLDRKLQSGRSGPPKWDPRARLGVYVGHSPVHSGNVALVLNPTTGHCSPQFHVVFDDEFTTVPFMREGTVPPNWRQLLNESTELATEESFNLAKTWNIPLDDTTIVRDHLLPSLQVSASDTAVSEGVEPASTQDKLFSEGDTPVFEGVIHSTIPFSSSSEGDRMPANEGE